MINVFVVSVKLYTLVSLSIYVCQLEKITVVWC